MEVIEHSLRIRIYIYIYIYVNSVRNKNQQYVESFMYLYISRSLEYDQYLAIG